MSRQSASIASDQKIERRSFSRRRPFRSGKPSALKSLIETPPRGDRSGIARRRCSQIATAVAAHYRREKQERGLLDYDDLIDKTLEMLDKRFLRLGALQTRLRRRSCADRRSAGYQPPTMEYRRSHHFRIHGRRRRARRGRSARSSRWATKSSRSFRFKARHRTNSIPAPPRRWRRKFVDAGLKFDPVSFTYSFRSGPCDLARRSIMCFATKRYLPEHPFRRYRLSDSPFARRRRSRA